MQIAELRLRCSSVTEAQATKPFQPTTHGGGSSSGGGRTLRQAMRHGQYVLALVIAVAGNGVMACSSHYSTLKEGSSGGTQIYGLNRAQALQVAHNALSESFPGRKITVIDGPPSGYVTSYRMMLDTYSQQVLALPAVGIDTSGTEVRGYYFEVSGSGTAIISGHVKNGELFDRVEELAKRTGRATTVTTWKPDLDADSGPEPATPHGARAADRLRELDSLRDQGLISPDEYRNKRARILDEM